MIHPLSLRLVDTHCHLDWQSFEADLDEVIERALKAGVSRMVTIGVDVASSQQALRLAERYGPVYASVGVHPNDAADFDESTLKSIRDLAQHHKVVAIGEIGLDYHWKKVAHDVQAKAFQMQLDLADEVDKPVIIHNREATADVMALLNTWVGERESTRPRGVLHSFFGSVDIAQHAFKLGFLIGFSGPLTFKKSSDLREVANVVPLDRFVVETDAPFLTPEPRRGRRNEPAYVRYIAERIAKDRGLPLDELAGHTTANAMRLFRWTETET